MTTKTANVYRWLSGQYLVTISVFDLRHIVIVACTVTYNGAHSVLVLNA